MRIQPKPDFVATIIEALPAEGPGVQSREVFVAIGRRSTPAYVRIVLRQLECAGQIVGVGHSYERVYRRAFAAEVA